MGRDIFVMKWNPFNLSINNQKGKRLFSALQRYFIWWRSNALLSADTLIRGLRIPLLWNVCTACVNLWSTPISLPMINWFVTIVLVLLIIHLAKVSLTRSRWSFKKTSLCNLISMYCMTIDYEYFASTKHCRKKDPTVSYIGHGTNVFFAGSKLFCERHFAEQVKPRCGACDEMIFSGEVSLYADPWFGMSDRQKPNIRIG